MKIILTLLLLTLAVYAFPQKYGDAKSDSTVREKIRTAKIKYVLEELNLTPEEAEKFTPLYNEFLTARQEIRREYRVARRSGMTEKELIELELKIQQEQLNLDKAYTDRFLKVIPAEKLIDLKNAERSFTRMMIRHVRQRQERHREHGRPIEENSGRKEK